MINTNYIGMQIGAFKVIGYQLDNENETIKLKVRCDNCGESKNIKLSYEKILRVKCGKCGRLDVVLPISYYTGSKLVKDTLTIGAYKYNKLKTEFNKNSQEESEIDFIRKMVNKENN